MFKRSYQAAVNMAERATSFVAGLAAMPLFRSMLRPPGLDGPPQDAASLCGADVPPARGAERDGCLTEGRSREFSARDVDELDREIEKDFWRQASLAHHDAQPRAATGAQRVSQVSTERLGWDCGVVRGAHMSACI